MMTDRVTDYHDSGYYFQSSYVAYSIRYTWLVADMMIFILLRVLLITRPLG